MLVAYSMPRACAKPLAALAVGAGVVLAVALTPGTARAQSSECVGVMKLLQDRVTLLQQWQTMQKKKQATAPAACNLFTQLNAKVAAAIVEVEKNGSWCHVPDQVLPTLKDEQPKVSKARGDACKAVQMQKKMEAQRAQQQQRGAPGPLGGGDSVVGGPIKMPQGAL
ncbi:hypothetical protein [uncultured Alsobacter sp.]|uniref:hypothetical protein n=1 Tax=uncultured Alsobacter sp. TaxID=1748258 RepID=UPI0025E7A22F|nr:hypothetical protein [uncultured Alsobacter sp.]